MAHPPQDGKSGLVTPEEMAAAIESSGYLLEARAARVLNERGFFAQQNAFWMDPNDKTNPIEVDVVGRSFEWENEENKSTATASVLVECKNNAQPFAFFVQRQEITELNDSRIQYGGFPSFSMDHVGSSTGPARPSHFGLCAGKDQHGSGAADAFGQTNRGKVAKPFRRAAARRAAG